MKSSPNIKLAHCSAHVRREFPNAADFDRDLSEQATGMRYRFPIHRSDLVSALHENGKVIAIDYEADAVVVQAILPRRLLGRFKEFEAGEMAAAG